MHSLLSARERVPVNTHSDTSGYFAPTRHTTTCARRVLRPRLYLKAPENPTASQSLNAAPLRGRRCGSPCQASPQPTVLSWAFKLGEVKPPIPPCTRDGVTSAGGYAPATSAAGSAPRGDSPRHSPSPCSYAQPSPSERTPPRRRTRTGARLAADPSDPPDPWYPRALAAKRVPMDPGIGAGAPLSHAPWNGAIWRRVWGP